MSEIDIKVPNIGDFKDVEVIEVLVSEGMGYEMDSRINWVPVLSYGDFVKRVRITKLGEQGLAVLNHQPFAIGTFVRFYHNSLLFFTKLSI